MSKIICTNTCTVIICSLTTMNYKYPIPKGHRILDPDELVEPTDMFCSKNLDSSVLQPDGFVSIEPYTQFHGYSADKYTRTYSGNVYDEDYVLTRLDNGTNSGLCTCDIVVILSSGCKCGGN